MMFTCESCMVAKTMHGLNKLDTADLRPLVVPSLHSGH